MEVLLSTGPSQSSFGTALVYLQAAAGLAKAEVPFTLVDPKEFMHHCCGALRAAVSPGNEADWRNLVNCPSPPGGVALTAIPFKDAYGEKFIQGKVISLNVANKKVIPNVRFLCSLAALTPAGSPGGTAWWQSAAWVQLQAGLSRPRWPGSRRRPRHGRLHPEHW